MKRSIGKKVLLISPPYERTIYRESKVRAGIPANPPASLPTLAAPLLDAGHGVQTLDLNVATEPVLALEETVRAYRPEYVGITFTTPLFDEMKAISEMVKQIDPNMVTLAGGPHASAMPEQTLQDSSLDMVVVGEGDFVLPKIVAGEAPERLPGVCYKHDGTVHRSSLNGYIRDLDVLPFPKWELYDMGRYRNPRLSSRRNPVVSLESSRGCVYGCTFCNKSTFGRTFRVKSPERVVDEVEHMLRIGFQEVQFLDDGFTTNLDRAKEICAEIMRRGLRFPWCPRIGVRVDRVDREVLRMMREAGCYRVNFGIESGNQEIIDGIKKGITLDQVRRAVRWANEVGLETFGYFMIGLPGETEENLQETIDFALSLNLDYVKAAVTIPLPGTPLYDEWEGEGLLKGQEWWKYNFSTSARDLYDHPKLSWDTIEAYYAKFHRAFYLRPGYMVKRLKLGLVNGNILYDAYYFLRTKWGR